MPASVEIYTKTTCPHCVRAKALLDMKKVTYREISIDGDEAIRNEMMERSGRRTVPQIFINGRAIGGCDDLHALHSSGELDKILSEQGA